MRTHECQALAREGREGVTLIAADDSAEPTVGIQGICATEFQALTIINMAILLWEQGKRPKRNLRVYFGF